MWRRYLTNLTGFNEHTAAILFSWPHEYSASVSQFSSERVTKFKFKGVNTGVNGEYMSGGMHHENKMRLGNLLILP